MKGFPENLVNVGLERTKAREQEDIELAREWATKEIEQNGFPLYVNASLADKRQRTFFEHIELFEIELNKIGLVCSRRGSGSILLIQPKDWPK